ncbi:2-dehydro-3-deoxygalactonokinase [Halocynthiibacter sp. C4]|uniref:2-dehydro-3-deoxygalactonokinase n=1 Tax=Halocynthiibacter sp. C4 TaxID=2992758 RepID=UPI00237C3433|nr:2-dehydro-3-deoxygalactonokinase [Halocynthiibacter sp. C4]MDE0591573.1 2-dehydro-3-deoxygalactonokinase [Halocynthiibacter sp. C4]
MTSNSQTLAFHWGGKSLRGWAIAEGGKIVEEFQADTALNDAKERGYASTFEDITSTFLSNHPHAEIVIAGMAGAKGGWIEAPYAPCPISPKSLIRAAVRFDVCGRKAMILPGATYRNSQENSDVMRGEEVQLLGVLHLLGMSEAVVSIPGKHCKQAILKSGQLDHFRSFVTGELFELLLANSLVGALAEGDEFSPAAFETGVEHGAATPLANAVFASRANTLAGDLPPAHVSSFLSGVLIGHEVAQLSPIEGAPVVLMASGVLADRYASAMKTLNIPFQAIDARDCMRAGLSVISEAMEPAFE